jgi:hypothetical protein
MKQAILMTTAVLLASPVSSADEGAKASVKVSVEIELDDILGLAELPGHVNEAIESGSDEKEIVTAIEVMKQKKVRGKAAVAVAKTFKKTADEDLSDKGMSGVVHGCLESGKKGTDLVDCFKSEWEKKPPKEKGKPEHAGPPDGKGKPEGKGKPDDKGKPEDKGKPDDKGKPEGKGKPEDKGKQAGAGKGGGKGKPDDKGKPAGAGKGGGKGKPDDKGKGPKGKGKGK